MAAFTFGYNERSGKPGGLSLGSKIFSKIMAARKLAEQEREFAQKVGEKYDTSLEEAGVERGYFFKKALQWEFGDRSIQTAKGKAGILGDVIKGKSGKTKLNARERVEAFSKLFDKGNVSNFRSKFTKLYEGYKDDPMLRPMSPLVPLKKVQKATTKKRSKRVSNEQIITAIQAIAESIQDVATSIGNSSNEVSNEIVKSNAIQTQIAQALQYRSNSLEDKLDDLVAAVNNQTRFEKQSADKAEDKAQERQFEDVQDTAITIGFDDTTTKEDESKLDDNVDQDVKPQRPRGGIPSMRDMMDRAGFDIPNYETGKPYIMDGPDEGYLARLHGNEMIIPMDNNFTQGQASAVDGKVRPRPQQGMLSAPSTPSISAERGYAPKMPIMNAETGSTPVTKRKPSSGSFVNMGRSLQKPMMLAMSMPLQLAGATAVAATSDMISKNTGDSPEVRAELARKNRSLASAFGLPPSITNAASKPNAKKEEAPTVKKKKKSQGMFEFLAKTFDSFVKKLTNLIPGNNTESESENEGTDGVVLDDGGTYQKGFQPKRKRNQQQRRKFGSGGPVSIATKHLRKDEALSSFTKGVNDYAIPGNPSVISNKPWNTVDDNTMIYPYDDGGGTPTIGWGSTYYDDISSGNQPVGLFDPPITKKEADQIMTSNVSKLASDYAKLIPRWDKMSDSQKAGLLLVGYNAPNAYGSYKVFTRALEEGNMELLANSGINRRGPSAARIAMERELILNGPLDLTKVKEESKPKPNIKPQQSIARNYGMREDDRSFFRHNGDIHYAKKVKGGFEFYKQNINPFVWDDQITDPNRLKEVQQTFFNKKEKEFGPRSSNQLQNAAAISSRPMSTGQIMAMNMSKPKPKAPLNSTLPGNDYLESAANPLQNTIVNPISISLS